MTHGMSNQQPATRWEDASPTGNGIVGALVYGGVANEQVVLNHDDLWFRSEPQAVPDISGHLPDVRALLARGRWREAGSFLAEKLSEAGYSHQVDPCHPACALKVVSETAAPFRDYRREVDFATGEVKWAQAKMKVGSLMIADGKIIAMLDGGILVIASASPDGYEELARAQVLKGQSWTYPVLCGGRIYCRSNEGGELVSLDVGGKG